MTRRAAVALLLFLAVAALAAHPSVSVVMDGRGNLYYSDLEQARAHRERGRAGLR